MNAFDSKVLSFLGELLDEQIVRGNPELQSSSSIKKTEINLIFFII